MLLPNINPAACTDRNPPFLPSDTAQRWPSQAGGRPPRKGVLLSQYCSVCSERSPAENSETLCTVRPQSYPAWTLTVELG